MAVDIEAFNHTQFWLEEENIIKIRKLKRLFFVLIGDWSGIIEPLREKIWHWKRLIWKYNGLFVKRFSLKYILFRYHYWASVLCVTSHTGLDSHESEFVQRNWLWYEAITPRNITFKSVLVVDMNLKIWFGENWSIE